MHEYVNGMRLINAFQMGSRSFRKYSQAVEEQHRMWAEISRATGPLYAVYVVLLECGILFLVPLGGWLYVHGRVTAGVFLLFAFVGTQYLTDIRPLQELASNFSYVLNGVGQVKEILDTPVFGGGRAFPEKHDIEVREMSFAYADGNRVLQNCSIHIAHGERMAFVGESGAGKTTILNLICKYYTPQGGRITIGGQDIAGYPAEQVLSRISLVDQDVFLFNDTVRENIRYARRGAADAEIEEACRLANCDTFIRKMEHGYDTMVGERQRLSVAWAILKDSPLLLLDEATVSLDIENELLVKQAVATF